MHEAERIKVAANFLWQVSGCLLFFLCRYVVDSLLIGPFYLAPSV